MADTTTSRLQRLIEAMDRPLLGLAIVSMCLYLLDLHGLMGSSRAVYLLVNLLIDSIFVVDLVLKLRVQGMAYVRTPWFLIDLLSCLPLLDVLASGIPGARAARFARGFRILRILRSLRFLRALRTIPAFDEFFDEAPTGASTRKFHRAMNLAMIALTVMVLVTIVAVRRQMTREFLRGIDAGIRSPLTVAHLRALGGSLRPPSHTNYVERDVRVDARRETAYFDLGPVDRRSNEIEFFLILGMLFSMILFMYILAYHQLDVTQQQLRALLSLALPRQVAERFLVDPAAYDAKVRMPATVVFMDFEDFTETCERLAHAPDRLSAHMERAMERLVVELSKQDMILDKFIGDAVMSFRGGPLVDGKPADHAYRAVRASLDCIRELKALDDPYFSRVKIGGASAADCLIGSFGTSRRLSTPCSGTGEPRRPPRARQRPVRDPEPLLRRDPPPLRRPRRPRLAALGTGPRPGQGRAGRGPRGLRRPFPGRSGVPGHLQSGTRGLRRPGRRTGRGRLSAGRRPARGGRRPQPDLRALVRVPARVGLPDDWQPVFKAHK
jgi:hypothetical protein